MTLIAARLQRFRFSLAVVLLVTASRLFAQAPSAAGQAWHFTYRIVPSAAGRALAGGEQLMDVAVWNGIVRITVRSGALRSLAGDGSTMLLRAADSTLVVINAPRRDVLTGRMGDLGALMAGPAAAAPIVVSDVRSATRNLGRGAQLLGYATRRAELAQGYTLRLTAPGVTRELRTEQTITLDVSRDVGRLDPGFRVFAEQFARSLGLPEPVRRQLRAAERGVPAGFPLRSTTEGVTVSGADTLRTTTRSELTDLRRLPVDTASFLIPPGYRVTEMSRLLGPRQRP